MPRTECCGPVTDESDVPLKVLVACEAMARAVQVWNTELIVRLCVNGTEAVSSLDDYCVAMYEHSMIEMTPSPRKWQSSDSHFVTYSTEDADVVLFEYERVTGC
jgi:hypothetical protein